VQRRFDLYSAFILIPC